VASAPPALNRRFGPPGPGERRRLLAGLSGPPVAAARFLLGAWLVRRRGRRLLPVRIVEAEAYEGANDPAAHAFRGRTPRNAPLWGPPGTVYVYFVYGNHHCLNLATQPAGVPGCVLVRAAEALPECGLPPDACRGPGRLCRALAIDTRLSGHHLFEPGSGLWLREGPAPEHVAVSPRVGIRHAAGRPLRFFDAAGPAVSRFHARAPRRKSG